MSRNMDYKNPQEDINSLPEEPGKKRCIDAIIEHMTADLQSYEGQYILLGTPHGQSVRSPSQPPSGVYYQPVRDNNEMMMMDVGGGKYVNVLFSKAGTSPGIHQPVGLQYIHYQQPPQNVVPPHVIDYSQSEGCLGARGSRGAGTPLIANGNGCLIENVVGNWVPNRSGTYSPFPGVCQDEEQPGPPPSLPTQPPVRKQRIVAEVKPMRPSYSDVLAKSASLTPPPTVKTTAKPAAPPPLSSAKPDPRKAHAKMNNLTNGKVSNNLKRENSDGSNEALAEKAKAAFRRWLSQELEPPSKTQVKKEKKKKTKQSKPVIEKEDKAELECKSADLLKCGGEEKEGGGGKRAEGRSHPSERSQAKPKPPRERDDRKGSSSRSDSRCTNGGRSAKNKRTQRTGRRKESTIVVLCKKWQEKSSYYIVLLTTWLINLLWDVTAMSVSLLLHMYVSRLGEVISGCKSWAEVARFRGPSLLGGWWKPRGKGKKSKAEPTTPPLPGSLHHNIALPTTGDEAMKRLLSCKGKDPYSILGVTSNCTDEEIKKYYKSQALLVHPDKNSQPGAEEAFKILVHAFDLIAEPEKRAAYDRYVAETNQVEQAWSELSDLISQLHEKMEYAANTIRCNNCGKRHKREITDRPSYAARYCSQCKIHHSVKEGDMWAESRAWGWWSCRYYACMEGSVYDITEWAHCQGPTVQRVKADSHSVQYRVLVGRPPTAHPPPAEPDLEDLLNTLYPPSSSSRSKKRSKKGK